MARSIHNKTQLRVERRHELRHAVERPCRIEGLLPGGRPAQGVTVNLSRSGALVKLATGVKDLRKANIGQKARLWIYLPHHPNYTPRALECSASIVRIEREGGAGPAVACRLEMMRIAESREPLDQMSQPKI